MPKQKQADTAKGKKTAVPVKTEKPAGSTKTFSKAFLLKSARFKDQRDVLAALLEEDKEYTLKQAEQKIQQFMKGEVL